MNDLNQDESQEQAVEVEKKFDKNKLRAYCDSKIVKVEVPEWPEMGDLYVKNMTGKSRDNYEAAMYEAREKFKETGQGSIIENIRACTIVASACHKDGTLIWEPEEAADLGDKTALVLDRIYNVATKLSGITAKDIADMEKSLEEDPT